jgi:hypothetical protein
VEYVTSVQYVTLLKYISHPSLVIYSFATPPIKLKLGQEIGGELLRAKHLHQSLQWANQTHWAAVRSYLLHSFLQVHSAASPSTSHGNMRNYAGPKPFSWAKPAYVRFSSSNFTVQDHIGSTIGDALSKKEVLRRLQYVGDRYLLACSRYKGTGSLAGSLGFVYLVSGLATGIHWGTTSQKWVSFLETPVWLAAWSLLFPNLVSNPLIAKVHSRQQTSGWEQPDIRVHLLGIWIRLLPSTSLDLLVECVLACLLSGPTLFFFLCYLPLPGDDQSLYWIFAVRISLVSQSQPARWSSSNFCLHLSSKCGGEDLFAVAGRSDVIFFQIGGLLACFLVLPFFLPLSTELLLQ